MINCPIYERPREKAIQYGINSLSNQELIAIVLRTGNKEMSVIQLANYLLETVGGFQQLMNVDYHQLIQVKGIKDAKAIELLASIEIAKRILRVKNDKYIIKEPQDGYNLVKNQLIFEKQEKVILLCLNNKLEVIKQKVLFVGGNSRSLIESQEIFQETLKCGSNRIMLIHNHPSGNPTPSKEDKDITEHLMKISGYLDIEVIDHLIIGHHCFYSFASQSIHRCKED